ncbi:helix-turn-helix domain-containing protein [Rhizobium ruizarguesonis]
METHDLALEEIRATMRAPKPRSITDFETFVLERLEGSKCHGNILDCLPLGLGGVLCEMVGTAVVHGRLAGVVDLDDEALGVACQVGFSYLRAGIGGLHLFLDEMQSSFSPPRGDYGGKAIYGKFYTNLAGRHDAELDFIKREIHDYAFKTMPLTSSASVFGTSPDARYVSFEELYREHAINPFHLHKTSIVTGMRDPNSPRSGFLPKDLAEKLLRIINDAVLPAEAAELVGVNYQSFANYTRQGIFKPHLTSAYGVAYNARFSRSELQRFIESIKPEGHSSSATATIFEASRRLSCSGAEIVNLLQKRQLKKVGWDDTQTGLSAVLVNLEEVAAHVTLPDHGHMSCSEAASRLGLTNETTLRLVNEGYLPSVIARNVTRRRPQRFITEADAAAFESRYVSFFQAKLAFDFSLPQLRKIVAGLKPVFPPEAVGAKFFARADLDAAVTAYVARMHR